MKMKNIIIKNIIGRNGFYPIELNEGENNEENRYFVFERIDEGNGMVNRRLHRISKENFDELVAAVRHELGPDILKNSQPAQYNQLTDEILKLMLGTVALEITRIDLQNS